MTDKKKPNTDHLLEGISDTKKAALKAALENAILGSENGSLKLEKEPAAFLRLVQVADFASKECSGLLVDAVRQAIRAGNSWAAIGATLGTSRQAAQQRFGGPRQPGESDMHGTRRVITGATAFSEMKMLEIEGAAGNLLVDFGALYLIVEESDRPWQHLRVFGRLRMTQLVSDGWTFVGAWFPFHYYKRPVD